MFQDRQDQATVTQLKEKERAYHKEWARSNPEKMREYYRVYNAKRKHSMREYSKTWREKNKEKLREQHRLWRENNKERERRPERRFQQYKCSAKNRGHVWELEYDCFLAVFLGACFYCGDTPARGVDRKDNSKGYLLENAVSCCAVCNQAKMDLPLDVFLNKVKQIAVYLRLV